MTPETVVAGPDDLHMTGEKRGEPNSPSIRCARQLNVHHRVYGETDILYEPESPL